MRKGEHGFDLYKERGQQSALFSEPINTLSNVAFFAAAFITMPFVKDWLDGILSAGCIIVGLGSVLYHSRPCKFTMYWDTGAIVMWVYFYLFIWAHYIAGLNIWWTLGTLTTFTLLSSAFIKKFSTYLNGSMDYIPVIAALLVCGSITWWQHGHSHLVMAGLLAAVSLVFRVVDNDVKLSSGTHFLWHILNGFLMAQLTLYVSMYVVR